MKSGMIGKYFSSIRFVQMEGVTIGTSWRYGNKVWDNVIAINLPDAIRKDSTVSFDLERQTKSFEDVCNKNDLWACNTTIILPEKIYCVKDVNVCR